MCWVSNAKASTVTFRAYQSQRAILDPTLGYGRTEREAPDVDGTVYIENAGNVAVGEFVSVRILQGFCYDRMAEVIV